MTKPNKGHKIILCIIDEVTNYVITVPVYQSKSEKIGDTWIDNALSKYCIPILYNKGSRQCLYVIINELYFKKFDIKIKTVAPL